MSTKMNDLHLRYGIVLLTMTMLLLTAATSQATIIWDPTGLGSGGGGPGTWDAGTTASWYDSTLGLPDILWPSGSDAEFNNTGGAVAVGAGGVTVNNMTFNAPSTSYTVTTGTANSITLLGKIIVNGAQANFGSGTTNPGIIAGTAGLVKDGTGTLNFDARGGANTYSGGTTILAGMLSVNREGALGATPGAMDYSNIVMKSGTTFTYYTNLSPSALRGIKLDGTATFNASSSGTLSWSGPITGTGGLNISLTGVALRPASNMLTYSGDTTIKSGAIAAGSDNPLPYAGNLNNGINGTAGTGTGNVYIWSGASIGMGSYNMRINGLNDGLGTGNGAGSIALTGTSSTKTLTLGDNNANGSFSGTISGVKLALTKMGTGIQTLSGANNYGSTTSAATVVNGGTLYENGSIGSLAVNTGATFSPISAILSYSTVNVRGPLNFATGSTEIFDIASATGYDKLTTAPGNSGATAGSVTLGGTLSVNLGYTPVPEDKFWIINNDLVDAVTSTFAGLPEGSTVFTSGGLPWNIFYAADSVSGNLTGGNDVVIASVPEPATWVMLIIAGGLCLMFRRTRNK